MKTNTQKNPNTLKTREKKRVMHQEFSALCASLKVHLLHAPKLESHQFRVASEHLMDLKKHQFDCYTRTIDHKTFWVVKGYGETWLFPLTKVLYVRITDILGPSAARGRREDK